MSNKKTRERKKQNRDNISGMSKFSVAPPKTEEEKAKIKADKSKAGIAASNKMTKEEKSARGKKAGEASANNLTEEEKKDRGKRGGFSTQKSKDKTKKAKDKLLKIYTNQDEDNK